MNFVQTFRSRRSNPLRLLIRAQGILGFASNNKVPKARRVLSRLMFKALPSFLTRGFAVTRLVTIFHQTCKKATKLVPRRTRLGVGHLEISTSRKIGYMARRLGMDCKTWASTAVILLPQKEKVIHTQLRARLRYPNVEMKSPRALRPGSLNGFLRWRSAMLHSKKYYLHVSPSSEQCCYAETSP